MPLPEGTRYRMKRLQGGGLERLAFGASGKVIEAKNMQTGATHTPEEFRKDRERGLDRLARRR